MTFNQRLAELRKEMTPPCEMCERNIWAVGVQNPENLCTRHGLEAIKQIKQWQNDQLVNDYKDGYRDADGNVNEPDWIESDE